MYFSEISTPQEEYKKIRDTELYTWAMQWSSYYFYGWIKKYVSKSATPRKRKTGTEIKIRGK